MDKKDLEEFNNLLFDKVWRSDVIKGKENVAKEGRIPYRAPLGYLNKKLDNGKSIVVKDPQKFDLVRKMWDMLLSGKYTTGQIMKIANEEWNLCEKKIARSSIYVTFRNPFYYGYFEYPKGSNNWYQGKHEPMITKEEFELVQKILDSKNKRNNKAININ